MTKYRGVNYGVIWEVCVCSVLVESARLSLKVTTSNECESLQQTLSGSLLLLFVEGFFFLFLFFKSDFIAHAHREFVLLEQRLWTTHFQLGGRTRLVLE